MPLAQRKISSGIVGNESVPVSSTGIVAAAQVVLPKDCNGNIFCEIMKLIVGPTVKWYIYGTFEYRKIRIATGFANVRIYDGLYFHKLELFVEVSCGIENDFKFS